MTKKADDHYLDPLTFTEEAPRRDGSWWPEWTTWLAARSGPLVDPPPLEVPRHMRLGDAPGTYVLED
jgi:polyhydroxyalkanoate synthase